MDYCLQLTQTSDLCRVRFPAMASTCEVIFDTTDATLALALGQLVQEETQRIERHLSRYRDDNIIFQINNANGVAVIVDDETADLLDFAATLWQLSNGLFDITSGKLRAIWRFDCSDNVPEQAAVDAILPLIGWQKVQWQRPTLILPAGMEIDLGGIGKEYAVDKTYDLVKSQFKEAFLVNFGGDLRVQGPRKNGHPWQVGIETVTDENNNNMQQQETIIDISHGGLATSGDSRRYLLKNNQRYSHILNPLTGWPVVSAPRSITTIAPTCVEAGLCSSLAMLMGINAEAFLEEQNVTYWSIR
ncbi:FAD:protein FMN transferase [Thalassolituus oleivorans]|uniref:FAD:protein FMN transferase n=1 Tax=Thalassolituus oleivorans TaxID=187493 RepID=UPI0030C7B9F8